MATYRIQRLFSKKSNKVAGHAVGAAVQGAVSGALLRDALKTKSNLAGAGAVLAGTAAALHTAEAIKAARKKGKEFSEFQKEFASVRLMKKQGKRLIDAAVQGNSKAAGRISSTMIRNGGTKHVRDHALSSGFEKVSNGVTGHAAKLDGVTATPELKKELFRENVKNNLKLSRQFRKTGGKLGPGGNPIM